MKKREKHDVSVMSRVQCLKFLMLGSDSEVED